MLRLDVIAAPGRILAYAAVRNSDKCAWNRVTSAWDPWMAPGPSGTPNPAHLLPLARFATIGPLSALYQAYVPDAAAGEPTISYAVLAYNQDSSTYSLLAVAS